MIKKCHDCGKEIKIVDKAIIGGKQLKYLDGEKEIFIFKCNDCYEKDKTLRKFRTCEVYSRVVGYIRPVSQWNKGKQQEYKERKEYKN